MQLYLFDLQEGRNWKFTLKAFAHYLIMRKYFVRFFFFWKKQQQQTNLHIKLNDTIHTVTSQKEKKNHKTKAASARTQSTIHKYALLCWPR